MADSLSISSKSTRRLHKLAQKLGSYSPKPSSSNGPAGSGAPELATALSAFTRKVQISPPEPQKQGHPTCAAVSGPIEPKPDPSAGPLEPDSGYGSSESTLATTTGPEKPRSKPTLNVFTKTVPTDVQNRFNDLRVLYAPALLEAVAKTKARNISMKLKYLGQSEETAKLYIVVQCDPGIVKKVERFLSQKHVLEDLGSDFLVDVRGGTLLSLSGSVTIGIWGILEAKATFCGMPILISSGDARRRATFVGLISVTMTRRRTVLYGVTAAHPAADLISRPMSGVDADDCDSDSEEPSQPLLDPSTEVSISQQVEESDALVSESKNLGTITGRGVLRTRDLALIELECEELLPNRISPFQPTAKGGEQRSMADTRMLYRSLDLFASDFQKHSFQACPAAVLTSRGLQYGQISSSRSALTMFLDAEFIEVFDFCPDQGAKLLPGDSGSWVVNVLTGEVYGHVVSTDAFGEASVIPIQTSLDAIKEQLHARNVRLPTARRISQLQLKRKISISVEATEPVKGNPSSAIPPEEQDARKSDETRNPKTKPQLSSVVDALSKLDATKTLDLQSPGRHSPLFESVHQCREPSQTHEKTFLPFDAAEIHSAIELAHRILNVGWSKANDAHQLYHGLKQDVEGLKGQLESLRLAIHIIRTRTGTLLAPGQAPQQLKQIFCDFKKPLEDCCRLLERPAPYGQGPVHNILRFLRVKDEVDIHRTRIAILSSKLSLARHSMEIEMRDGQSKSISMLECTDLVLQSLEAMDTRMAALVGETLPTQPAPTNLEVPQPVEDLLLTLTTARFESHTNIPVDQGIDEVIFYLDRATQWQARKQTSQQSQASKWANLLTAYWLLRATKASKEYQTAVTTPSVANFEQQFPRLGMTVQRFFSKLEQRILEAHTELAQAGEGAPPMFQLLEVIEQDVAAWHEYNTWIPQNEKDDNPRFGELVATCRLRNVGPTDGQLVEIYRHDQYQHMMTIIKRHSGGTGIAHRVDLRSLQLTPSLEAVSPNSDLYSVLLATNRHESFRLDFQGRGDLFKFQERMTGYKVVDDFPNTFVVSVRANAVIGHERRASRGRVQVWSPTRSSPGQQTPDESLDSGSSTKRRLGSRRTTILPTPPLLSPLQVLSRLRLSLERGHVPPSRSIDLETPRSQSDTTQSDTASHPRAVTVASSKPQSSSPSLGGLTKLRRSVIEADKRGSSGYALDEPTPPAPRLVMYLPPTQAQGQREAPAPSGSLLVVDIDQHVRINNALCGCQEAESRGQCRKVILEVAGTSGMTASETINSPELPWNLASVGRYQDGEGLGVVKRLKKVALEFASVEERVRFVGYFVALRKLYMEDLLDRRRGVFDREGGWKSPGEVPKLS